ncbi:MAG: metallophosphoesterase [Hymenobacteraceae bacterium]|nr:metallophosphoesterase [Hymenobacteraceae bacterium]MDX5397832.1 metallophosphoesterase [Hymenobacteraceae bacterium]MDX5443974.1 metallophosphoesterase [Hymenobacteraceae bacterium]MDX5513909.1 metallophosphoesterase [Hymenobacteraceae bacterium]
MVFYLLAISVILFFSFFLYQYWKELQFRHKPFYRLSDIGWRTQQPPPPSEKVFSVALVGDAGGACSPEKDAVMRALQHWAAEQTKDSITVFLGDNIYPVGLPPENDKRRKAAEDILHNQLKALEQFKGRTIYLSGNHDWNKGRSNGYAFLLRQQEYLIKYLNDSDCYLPMNGCPGPVPVQLTPDVLLIVINTQWWVQRGVRPIGKQYQCDVENEHEFFRKLDMLLRQNRHQRILIAAHHPLYSNAIHGGQFSVKQHIFPLTAAYKRFYIPFPLIGSLYPLYRRLFGASEDMSHPRYKKMRRRLLNVLGKYKNIVYAAGHDHNLQYFNIRKNHFIVSGSASKLTFVQIGGRATFTHEAKGFFVIDYYQNGETWMTVLEAPREEGKFSTVTFRKKLERE